MSDPVTEADLLAYVDDQLAPARRIEVEEYLARDPESAARVMADLKDRDALRLLHAAPLPRPPEATLGAAARLERVLAWKEFGLKLRRIAAVVALIGVGWFAHGQVGLGVTDSEASPKPPAFVEDALHSHETALVRARMASQTEAAGYDPAELLAETGVRLPPLPDDWHVRDAQVFPSRDGHSVEVAVDADDLGRVSLFAAHVPVFDVIDPTVARFDKSTTVYWQTGQLAYALTGTGGDKALERAATRLARKLQ
ncbi:anti-sigma factor family protein [Microvirga lotononidis]|uniref:Putative transmembrane transcriptional regulator (Anti-sigma factor) n=1 Tax=Microvirga lotononidis TaxID=864069 RepID=I4YPS2_9HYPH|nr:anti-sigma factor [Microvirga lotononidis]EIM25964.1 putative transmembrane transcriptional regulator (anti-sigma factor) [Microvirga lotononidis]WQO25877.1 anti-sigma factor [Microvirga lotononidis]